MDGSSGICALRLGAAARWAATPHSAREFFPTYAPPGKMVRLFRRRGKPRRGAEPYLGVCPALRRPAVFSCDADDRGLFRGFRALAIRGEATTGNVSLHIAPCPVLFVAFQMPHDYVGVYQCPAADGTFALLIPSTDKGGYAFRRPRSTPDVVIVLRSGQRLSPRKTTSSLVNGAEFQSNAFFEVPRASCVRGTGAVCHAAS